MTTLELPPELDTDQLVASIEASMLTVRQTADALDALAEEVARRRRQIQPILTRLEAAVAAARGEAKPVGRPLRSEVQPKEEREGLTPAEELLRICGPRAWETALAWARERGEFSLDDFDFTAPRGNTAPQMRTAFRALLADGALSQDGDTWAFVREPLVESAWKRIIDYLGEHGPTRSTDIAEATGLPKGNMHGYLSALMVEGRISVTRTSNSGRNVDYSLVMGNGNGTA